MSSLSLIFQPPKWYEILPFGSWKSSSRHGHNFCHFLNCVRDSLLYCFWVPIFNHLRAHAHVSWCFRKRWNWDFSYFDFCGWAILEGGFGHLGSALQCECWRLSLACPESTAAIAAVALELLHLNPCTQFGGLFSSSSRSNLTLHFYCSASS